MAAARQSPVERERRHEESTRLLENAIYALEWRQHKISQTNARLLFALVSAGDSDLFNASLPYLPIELGGPESPPPLPLEDGVHAVLRQQLSRRFSTIFAAYPLAEGKRLSKLDRSLLGLSKPSLSYGEITFEALAEMLYRHVPLPPRGGVFIDLGSGTGRAVIALAMLHKFYRVAGVEILPSLHEAALVAAGEYRTRMRIASGDKGDDDDEANVATQFMPSARTPRRFQIERERAAAAALELAATAASEAADGATTGSESQQPVREGSDEGQAAPVPAGSSCDMDDAHLQGPPVDVTDVTLVCGDLLEVDWWTAGDIVFANATAFDDALMSALGERALRMKKGSYFITVTKPLPSFHFKTVHQGLYQMSWGMSTVHVALKTTERNAETAVGH